MKVLGAFHAPLRTLGIQDTMADAATTMAFYEIGALPVFNDAGRLAGIVTERDLVRAIADEVAFASTSVSDYMSEGPIAIGIDEDLDRAATLMATHHTRHLPVLDKGRVVGMLSIRDVLDAVRETG